MGIYYFRALDQQIRIDNLFRLQSPFVWTSETVDYRQSPEDYFRVLSALSMESTPFGGTIEVTVDNPAAYLRQLDASGEALQILAKYFDFGSGADKWTKDRDPSRDMRILTVRAPCKNNFRPALTKNDADADRHNKEVDLTVADLSGYGERIGENSLFIIEGKVKNRSRVIRKYIRIRAFIFDQDKIKVAEKDAICGRIISREELKKQPVEFFKGEMVIEPQTELEMVTPPGKATPFMVIVKNPPSQVKEFKIEILEAPKLKEGSSLKNSTLELNEQVELDQPRTLK